MRKRSFLVLGAGVALATTLGACSSTPVEETAAASADTSAAASTTPTPTTAEDFDAKSLLSQAKFVPYPAEGKRQGFLLERVEPASAWAKAGLRQGDVVVAIGEKDVADTATSFDLLRAIANPGTAPIEVVRRSGSSSERFALPATVPK
jgi:type II secretory pathway component PulC